MKTQKNMGTRSEISPFMKKIVGLSVPPYFYKHPWTPKKRGLYYIIWGTIFTVFGFYLRFLGNFYIFLSILGIIFLIIGLIQYNKEKRETKR